MGKLNRKIRTVFWIALALSVGFPLGILGVIFGAINKAWLLFGVGIAFTVVGFYLMPLLWVNYAEKRGYRAVLQFIENAHLYTVAELSTQTQFEPEKVRQIINWLIKTGCLTGYLFINDRLELNINTKQTAKSRPTKKCANCGAMMDLHGFAFVCDYCGYSEKKE